MWRLLRQTLVNWSTHKTARLGAALAYYSVFSLGPVVIIAVAIAGLTFGEDAARGAVSQQIRDLLGETGAQAVEAMIADAARPREGLVATVLGLVALIFAALGVLIQLKDAFNTVWEVDTSQQSGIWPFVRSYLISLAGVTSLGFLLLVSLIVSAGIAAASKLAAPFMPEVGMQVVSSGTSVGIIALMFAMMFKWLPDTAVAWGDVWLGAGITAALFEVGKFLIGLYIGKQGLESTFGAAASLAVVLIWVYYSSQIVLFGAELTHARAELRDSPRSHQSPANPSKKPPALSDREGQVISAIASGFSIAFALMAGWFVSRQVGQVDPVQRGGWAERDTP